VFVGNFVIKVFDNIVIKSQVQDNKTKKGKLVNIDFNQNFTANVLSDINKSESSYADNYTITTFKNISKQEDKDKALEIDSIETLYPFMIPFAPTSNEISIFSASA
jgi:hypothetical protein